MAVGGKNHVADAFCQQAVALFTGAQGFAPGDLLGNVLGYADQSTDLALGIVRFGAPAGPATTTPGPVEVTPPVPVREPT